VLNVSAKVSLISSELVQVNKSYPGGTGWLPSPGVFAAKADQDLTIGKRTLVAMKSHGEICPLWHISSDASKYASAVSINCRRR
jgi:hypothetical protein